MIVASDSIVTKELTVLARKSDVKTSLKPKPDTEKEKLYASKVLNWLKDNSAFAAGIAERGNFGIFGTSIGAGWLYGELDGNVDFFADEDTDRIGNTFLGKEIIGPEQAGKNSSIYIALPLSIAEKVYKRLNESVEAELCLPLPFP
jgi:hypothetical protein